ncbi:MAG: DUF929 family protein [Acidimicrobiales bacterium]
MSAQQAGGNRGSSSRPGQGRSGQGPGQAKPGSGRPGQAKPGSGRPSAGRGPKPGGGAGRPPGKGRPGTAIASRPPGRFSPSTIAFGAAAIAVVVVLVVVLVTVIGKGSNSNATGNGANTVSVTPAEPNVLREIQAVTPAEAAQVGLPSSVVAPQTDKGQAPLTSGGKPEMLFIGGEFCPYCAAERWAMVMTLYRFGSFTNLHETTSSPFDTDASTATFTFYRSSYSSSDIAFAGIEHESNDTTALGTRTVLVPLTTQQNNLWTTYEAHFGQQTGFPFIDIGNKIFVTAPQYDPAILQGLDQSAIAAKLSNPSDPVAQAIIGAANYLTAAICSVDGQQPNQWCSASAVTAAAKAMGVS